MSRRALRALLTLVTGACVLSGCVYYNGMYNTNRLAKSARKAERDGRTFEANNLWGQVITRAESLVVRHPRSKYADEANVLRGLALARLDQCPAAVGPLGRVTLLDRTGDLTEESALALGRCQLELGDASLADLAFALVIDSRDPARRREARFQHARALRMTGRYEEALALIRESPDPRAGNDLLLALAGTGRGGEALTVADSLLALNDTLFAWDSVIATLGGRDPRVASGLIDRLQDRPGVSAERRARRLYDDALRMETVDTARATARLRQAAAVPGRTESGELARLALLRRSLRAARTLDDLAPHADSLAALAAGASGAAGEAVGLDAVVDRLRHLPDSTGPEVQRGDLRLFLGAEDARDVLQAPSLAAALFRTLVDTWPSSPYAPKALLAAERLEPTDMDAARLRLDSLYVDSPYMAVLRGEDTPSYRLLEDSLEAFASARTLTPRGVGPGGRRGAQPGAPGERRPQPRPSADPNAPPPRRVLEP
ncbi:MAG TPA: hypothetical protein VMY76_03320 [Gemmatimonadales bacterium]|nr:hypothetical protein [Gemmatimonadales bacterium]